jgi:hypothetical protein
MSRWQVLAPVSVLALEQAREWAQAQAPALAPVAVIPPVAERCWAPPSV